MLWLERNGRLPHDCVLGSAPALCMQVSIGSYPNTNAADSSFKVKLAFSSRTQDALAAAVAAVREGLPGTREAAG